MNFHEILSVAEQNRTVSKSSVGLVTKLPPPRKEKKDGRPKSDVVLKLLQEKEMEKKRKEEKERQEEERKKRTTISKKKPEEQKSGNKKSSHSSKKLEPVQKPKGFVIPKKSQQPPAPSVESSSDSGDMEKSVSSVTVTSCDRSSSPTVSGHQNSPTVSSHKHSDHASKHKHGATDHEKDHTNSGSAGASDKKHGHSAKHHSAKDKVNHHDTSHHSSSQKSSSSSHKSSSSSHKSSSGSHKSSSGSHKSSSSSHKSNSSAHKSSSESHKSISTKSGDSSHKSSSGSHNRTPSNSHKSSSSHSSATHTSKNSSSSDLRKSVNSKVTSGTPVAKPHSSVKTPTAGKPGVATSAAKKVDPQSVQARIQMILQKTKEKLAQAREEQNRHRGSKRRSGLMERKDKSGKNFTSKSTCKSDSESDDDMDVSVNAMDQSNEDIERPKEDIIKNIKARIDEKLTHYNFEERPLKPSKPKKSRHHHSQEKKSGFDKHGKRKSVIREHKHERRESKPEKRKIKKRVQQAPPPMDFQALLKIAEVKSKEKVVQEPVYIKPKTKPEEVRPLTQKEKERRQRERESRKRKHDDDGSNDEQHDGQDDVKVSSKLDISGQKSRSEHEKFKHPPQQMSKSFSKLQQEPAQRHSPSASHSGMSKSLSSLSNGSKSMFNSARPKTTTQYDSENENVLVCGPSPAEKKIVVAKPQKTPASAQQAFRSQKPAMAENSPKLHRALSGQLIAKKSAPPKAAPRPEKAAPAPDASNPWDRIYSQIQKNNPKPEKRRRQVIESSDEDDDYDMDDDFIDDGDDGRQDYSKHIRDIFGYDKRKYRDDEDDVDNMEANFSTIMKEEARSARLGLKEDLEDMKKEEEELRQKRLAKMKKRK